MNKYQVSYTCEDGTEGSMPVDAPAAAQAIEAMLHRIGPIVEDGEQITFVAELKD